MMILVYLVSLPIAVASLASVLAVRDGINGSWAMIRLVLLAAVVLLIVWLAGQAALAAVGYAFATVVVLHVAGFYAARWWFTGV